MAPRHPALDVDGPRPDTLATDETVGDEVARRLSPELVARQAEADRLGPVPR